MTPASCTKLLCLGLGIDEQQIGFALYDQNPLMFIFDRTTLPVL
ncbi:hypothetical protein ACTG10_23435 [Aeromonas hydrophila]